MNWLSEGFGCWMLNPRVLLSGSQLIDWQQKHTFLFREECRLSWCFPLVGAPGSEITCRLSSAASETSDSQPGVRVPPGVRTGTFKDTRKIILSLLIPLLGYLFTFTTYKFEITTILITNILLIWRVRFMKIGCQAVRK